MDDLQKAHPISIHSARVGGDLSVQSARSTQPNFNPLRPCGRRPTFRRKRSPWCRFQSTPPVWAETITLANMVNSRSNFNPLRPCGRRQSRWQTWSTADQISIHSARVGGDQRHANIYRWQYDISIHSARVGGDPLMPRRRTTPMAFQSTPPVWAETRNVLYGDSGIRDFNPLRPCGRRL